MNSDLNDELRIAVLKGNLEQVKILLSKGADVNYRIREHQSTFLHYSPTQEVVKELLLSGACVNAKDEYEQTPLCCAVASGNIAVVKALLSSGADVHVKMVRGNTPLHCANTVDLTQVLLQKGAKINVKDDYGRTPLHSALIEKKDFSVIKTLLSAGADVSIRIGTFENTLLHYADSLEVTKELLSHGVDVNAITIKRQSPLHCAIKHLKELAVVREILCHGANINAIDSDGNTALMYAIRNHSRNYDVIKLLLEYKADFNIQSFDYSQFMLWTPLECAMYHDPPGAKLIIKISLLRNLKDFQINIYIDNNAHPFDYGTFTPFLDECVSEVVKMKRDKICNNLTLFDLVTKKYNFVKPLYRSYKVLEEEISNSYPNFCDIILPNLMLYLERGRWLNKVRQLQIVVTSVESNKEVALNPDCISLLAEYLSDDDLFSLVSVFE